MDANVVYREEWQKLFAQKKALQIHNGACAAMVVDCDCDACLYHETNWELRRRGVRE